MTKDKALELLIHALDVFRAEEELPELHSKLDQMSEEDFADDMTYSKVYTVIVSWYKKRKRKPSTAKAQAYYKLLQIDTCTEKAIGVVTSTNGCISRGARSEFVQWIPLSQTKTINNQTFVPAWIISKNDLWNFIDKESKIN